MTVPVVFVTHRPTGDRWAVMLKRSNRNVEVSSHTKRVTAESIAAELRGALADAYHAGVAGPGTTEP